MTDKSISAAIILWLGLLAASMGGWVINLVKLVEHVLAGDPVTAMFMIRIIGIPIFIIGGIVGWF